eukprot:c3993_g1_i1.p1 GENE.c3993_g1_i1~~c3993_g1_i1.p1  ORF type:complete len:100 (+),score=26.54 c3993_g1_i1:323-622(+)
MMFTGHPIPADRALALGLINAVVPHDSLTTETHNMASKIASKSRAVLGFGKHKFYQQIEMDLNSAYQFASAAMVENLAQQDCVEGISAFLEKRSPVWKA